MFWPLGSNDVLFMGWGEGTKGAFPDTDCVRYSPLRPPTVYEELSAARALTSAYLEAS